jgi:hypothetical protein
MPFSPFSSIATGGLNPPPGIDKVSDKTDWGEIEGLAKQVTKLAGGDAQQGYMLVDMARNRDPGMMKHLFPDGIDENKLKLLSNYMYPGAQLPGMGTLSALGGAAYEGLAKPALSALPASISGMLPEGIAPKPGVSVGYDPGQTRSRIAAYFRGLQR